MLRRVFLANTVVTALATTLLLPAAALATSSETEAKKGFDDKHKSKKHKKHASTEESSTETAETEKIAQSEPETITTESETEEIASNTEEVEENHPKKAKHHAKKSPKHQEKVSATVTPIETPSTTTM